MIDCKHLVMEYNTTEVPENEDNEIELWIYILIVVVIFVLILVALCTCFWPKLKDWLFPRNDSTSMSTDVSTVQTVDSTTGSAITGRTSRKNRLKFVFL